MPKKVALIENDEVVNIIVCEDDWNGTEWEGVEAVHVDHPVGPGWSRRQGSFVPPPREVLFADVGVITPDETAIVTYENTHDDAPASIIFDVNGKSTAVPLSNGKANLEVVPNAVGEVHASVNRPVTPVTIEVQAP